MAYSNRNARSTWTNPRDTNSSAFLQQLQGPRRFDDQHIEDRWSRSFNTMPYTTFCMIDYLLVEARISYVDYLRQPDILKCRLQEHGISSLLNDESDLEELIALPGRCTSFSLHVVG